MKVVIDMNEIELLSVQDHTGKRHELTGEDPRPLPYCVECQQPVTRMIAFSTGLQIAFGAECHGERTVVSFITDESGGIVALPCFGEPAEERSRMLAAFREMLCGKRDA